MLDNRSVSPVIGVGVLVWRDEQLLLGKRISEAKNVCWQFPGGHLEHDESVLKCAAREVLEETGLAVTSLRHLGFTDRSFLVAQREYITLFVSCDYVSGEAQVLEADRCETWQWFDYRELPSPLFQPIEILISQQLRSQQSLFELHSSTPSFSSL